MTQTLEAPARQNLILGICSKREQSLASLSLSLSLSLSSLLSYMEKRESVGSHVPEIRERKTENYVTVVQLLTVVLDSRREYKYDFLLSKFCANKVHSLISLHTANQEPNNPIFQDW